MTGIRFLYSLCNIKGECDTEEKGEGEVKMGCNKTHFFNNKQGLKMH